MKPWIICGSLVLLSASCGKREQEAEPGNGTAPPPRRTATADGSAEASETDTEPAPGRLRERPETPGKKIWVAEPVADHPGMVMSPFSGRIIDVRGIPAGTLVADPTFPASEQKYFRVPEMPELPPDDGPADGPDFVGSAMDARPVPGKAGFIFSPYNNKIIDTTGLEPGTVFQDPTLPEDDPRMIRIPSAGAEMEENP